MSPEVPRRPAAARGWVSIRLPTATAADWRAKLLFADDRFDFGRELRLVLVTKHKLDSLGLGTPISSRQSLVDCLRVRRDNADRSAYVRQVLLLVVDAQSLADRGQKLGH